MKNFFWRIVNYLYIFMRMAKKRAIENNDSNSILLIMTGGIGDALLDAQAVEAMLQSYNKQGKLVYLVAPTSMMQIYKKIIHVSNVSFLSCDFLNGKWAVGRPCLKQVIKILKKIRYEKIIIRFSRNSLKPFRIVADLQTNDIAVVLCDCSPIVYKKRFVYSGIKYMADEVIELSENHSYVIRAREFATVFGSESYRTHITYLPKQFDFQYDERPYITIAVDSSVEARRWPENKVIDLVRRLLDCYQYDIILTGNKVSDLQKKQYTEAFETCRRVVNAIGKLKLDEWIELIRNSEFHIGVDSGSIHVAASVGTLPFCLAGVWDKNRFLPYEMEEETVGTVSPVCIYRKDVDINSLYCRDCHAKGRYGWGNHACYSLCKSGKPCLCLEQIEVDDVMDVINRTIKEGIRCGYRNQNH